jgi:hypothetical protein
MFCGWVGCGVSQGTRLKKSSLEYSSRWVRRVWISVCCFFGVDDHKSQLIMSYLADHNQNNTTAQQL